MACLTALTVGNHSSQSQDSASPAALSPAALSAKSTQYVSATIMRKFNSKGVATNDQLVLTSPREVARLEKYFPEMGSGRRGPTVAGWLPKVIIQFKPKMGRTIRVMTNYQVWTEGTGDWDMRPSFKFYLDQLFANRTSK